MNVVQKIVTGLAVAAAVAAGFLFQQRRLDSALRDANAARHRAEQLQADLAQARSDTRTVTQYVDRVQIVREKGDTLIQKVPVYVTREADSACPVPAGFVRLHDAAAAGVPVGDPRAADAAASGVALSAVASTVAANYTACLENAEQLSALQEAIRNRQAAEEARTP